jgi:transposase
MDRASLPDLETLDRDALLALARELHDEHEKLSDEQEHLQALLAVQQTAVRRLEAELESQVQRLTAQASELRSRSEHIEHLKLLVEKYRHMLFGAKSEKLVLQIEQLEFELEEDETTLGYAEAIAEQFPLSGEPKERPARKPLPEHLPREVLIHTPKGQCCPECGGQLREFGEDISEQLEYIPESFKVIRHIRPKFTCTGCDRVVEAFASSRPIERGLAGPNLLAKVIVSKYGDYVGFAVMLCRRVARDWMLCFGNLRTT